MPEPAADGPREKTGTFLVTAVDDATVLLRDVHDAEVHTVERDHDGLLESTREGEVLEATLRTAGSLAITWTVASVAERQTVTVERSGEAPTRQAQSLAADQPVGEVAVRERAGTGEVHVLPVPPEEIEDAAAEVVADPETRARAARLGVGRVEVRTGNGVVSVRYLP